MPPIEARLAAILSATGRVPAQSLQPGARLVDLGLDSLRQVEVFFAIEESFGITLPWAGGDAPLETWGDLLACVTALAARGT